jgi:REP element-mobilizing transposase RayT
MKDSVGKRSTQSVVDDLKYHLLWVPKYLKHSFDIEMRENVKEVFQPIAGDNEFSIDTIEMMEDHMHVFTEAPPRYIESKFHHHDGQSWCEGQYRQSEQVISSITNYTATDSHRSLYTDTQEVSNQDPLRPFLRY